MFSGILLSPDGTYGISNEVVSIKNDQIEVETTDGFLMTYFVNELIKENNSNELKGFISREIVSHAIKEKVEPIKRNFTKEKKSKKI